MEVLCGHQIPGWLVHRQAQAINLLRSVLVIAGSSIIFPSPKGQALSDMALSQLMRGMRDRGELTVEAVPHGFRSSFRDWAAEQTNYPDEIRKAASGHAVGDPVKGAYQRTDLLDKRRMLMHEWGKFLDQPSFTPSSKVSPLRKTA
jgi:integrase